MAKRTGKPAQPLGKLREQAQAQAQELGLELVELVMARESTGNVLRFTIDRPEGVSLDDCEAFHRRALKLAKDLDYDYMEVSSPGADRPLKTQRDFERAMGQLVEVRFYRQVDGQKRMVGALAGWDDESVALDVGGAERALSRADISLIRLTLDEDELTSPLFDQLEAQAHEDLSGPDGAGLDEGGSDLE